MMCTKLDRVPSRPFSHVIEVFESFFVRQIEIGIVYEMSHRRSNRHYSHQHEHARERINK